MRILTRTVARVLAAIATLLASPTPSGASCLLDPESVCGNTELDEGEACDDGNLESGDGCSEICAVEPQEAGPTKSGGPLRADGYNPPP